ncbi:hypothetical protein LJR153_003645 [Paenibacillus sp. LjRoot153]|uniref:hypothetical protein n=1 Tax=Paenibacillus sp. LjRoot153 TaxID=3342270 RepID=UPI003ECCEBC1
MILVLYGVLNVVCFIFFIIQKKKLHILEISCWLPFCRGNLLPVYCARFPFAEWDNV